MLGQVMSRGEIVDFFVQRGLREECAWEIAGSLASEVMDALDDAGLLAASGQMLSEHKLRLQAAGIYGHECPRFGVIEHE
jgi:hypothetical protein